MAWLDVFRTKQKRFIDEQAHEENRRGQLAMSPATMAQLRAYDVTPETRLRLEFFFYTNTAAKGRSLAQRLSDMGYDATHRRAAQDKRLHLVTGWTTPLTMSDQAVTDWTERMCNLGYECDCEFDGWGTNPAQ